MAHPVLQAANQPPRHPNSEELAELLQWQISNQYTKEPHPEDLQYDRDLIETSYIGVFEDYMTDSPGYAGKVMFIVWPGSPSFFNLLIWNEEGTLETVKPDYQEEHSCRHDAQEEPNGEHRV